MPNLDSLFLSTIVCDNVHKINIPGHSYSGKCESASMVSGRAELLLEEMEIKDIERFLRKKKLEK